LRGSLGDNDYWDDQDIDIDEGLDDEPPAAKAAGGFLQ
jgi:hypothetical protein